MKEGLYKIEKFLKNRKTFEENDTKEGTLIRVSKNKYSDNCAICGKETY